MQSRLGGGDHSLSQLLLVIRMQVFVSFRPQSNFTPPGPAAADGAGRNVMFWTRAEADEGVGRGSGDPPHSIVFQM